LNASETRDPTLFGEQAPILPDESISGGSLVAVIAIMSFLATLMVGIVRIANISAEDWRSELSNEMTIQVKPAEGRDLDSDTQKVLAAAQKSPGVSEARAYTKEETEKLLEPWLGSDADLKSLPVPRLIRLRMSDRSEENIAALRYALSQSIPGAVLNDHHGFSSRLAGISRAVFFFGTIILLLVLLATILSVSFATRGAVAGNRVTVEVLHFVGARNSYIAKLFQRHFLKLGLKGAVIGGAIAALLFALSRFSSRLFDLFAGGGDAAFLLSSVGLDTRGYFEIAATVIFVALVTAISSRLTVYSTLRGID
jgi:cell division transport system permease protein